MRIRSKGTIQNGPSCCVVFARAVIWAKSILHELRLSCGIPLHVIYKVKLGVTNLPLLCPSLPLRLLVSILPFV